MSLVKFCASANDAGRTLFKFLVKCLDNVPISKIEKLFRQKDIVVNGQRCYEKTYTIKEHDWIEVYGVVDYHRTPAPPANQLLPLLQIIYEDEHLLVVNKPINVAVHGAPNCLDYQVLNYLNYRKHDSFQPSHVGRLDKPTSGLMLYAKTYLALVQLNQHRRHFQKYYQLKSDFPWTKKRVVCYARFDPRRRCLVAQSQPTSQLMETVFFQEANQKYAQIITGKKHQIRLTLQYLNYPILGDQRYGGRPAARLFLHCAKVVLNHLDGALAYLNGVAFVNLIEW